MNTSLTWTKCGWTTGTNRFVCNTLNPLTSSRTRHQDGCVLTWRPEPWVLLPLRRFPTNGPLPATVWCPWCLVQHPSLSLDAAESLLSGDYSERVTDLFDLVYSDRWHWHLSFTDTCSYSFYVIWVEHTDLAPFCRWPSSLVGSWCP